MKRIHIHVGVSDLEQSIRFYSSLFGSEPSTVKTDYAKWMLDDPRVNFAISNGHANPGIEHLGIQAESDEELAEIRERLSQADTATFDQHETTCCYAKSNKTWARDPQDVVWETFHTMANVQYFGESPDLDQDSEATDTVAPTGDQACC